MNLGIDPKLFTTKQIKIFLKNNKITEIKTNLVDNIYKKRNKKELHFIQLIKK